MADVYCVGEALIDFVSKEAGKSLSEAKVFEKHVGGAPLNVAVGVSRLGVDTGFVGRVGNDPFGKNIIICTNYATVFSHCNCENFNI